MIAAFAGLNAFSNLREHRSSQMRHPVHFEASALIGGPFLRVTKISLSLVEITPFSQCAVLVSISSFVLMLQLQPWGVKLGSRNINRIHLTDSVMGFHQ
jgi:hypothetical protein